MFVMLCVGLDLCPDQEDYPPGTTRLLPHGHCNRVRDGYSYGGEYTHTNNNDKWQTLLINVILVFKLSPGRMSSIHVQKIDLVL